jgi:hypothetical protein
MATRLLLYGAVLLLPFAVRAATTIDPAEAEAAQPEATPAAEGGAPAAAETAETGGVRGAADWVARKTLALQPLDPSLSLELPLAFGRRLLWDTGYILTAPARWDACDWGKFGLFTAGTGAALGLDSPVDTWSRVKNPRSNTEADIENAIQKFGEIAGVGGVVGGSYLFGLVTDNRQAKLMAFDVAEGLIITNLVFVEPLKAITGRDRPNTGNGPYDWFAGGKSFPSGHTATAFSLAAGVSMYADDSLWVAIPAYTLATGVGFSRIRADAHFLSDVFVGAVIGVVSTRTVIGLERQRIERQRAAAPQLVLAPLVEPDARGVQLVVRF